MRHFITAEQILFALTALVFALILLLFGFLFWFSIPIFFNSPLALFSLQWRPESGLYGIIPMVTGSLLLGLSSLLIAFPIAVGICGFFLIERYHIAALWLRRLLRLMAGIPTVVYGLAAIFILVPLLREVFRFGSGFCLLAVVIMVVLLILPVMVTMLDNHCQPLAKQIRLASYGLGFSDVQIIYHLVLPNCTRGMVSAALLGFNRAIGDTLLPLMLAGNAPQITGNALQSIRTLTAHIGLVLATENGSAAYNSLFAAGLLLLLISISVTLAIKKMQHHSYDSNYSVKSGSQGRKQNEN